MDQPPLTILYFAWLRERAGRAEEQLSPPETIRTVADLIAWLSQRSPDHAAAFAHIATIRCAINQEFSDLDATIKPGDEIAFFPPVTGG
ncbi:MAG: molybdopterin converting factor subunit 1 [Acetobacteraceae bacterium]|nr:molybdopterin converting factor subunit 1 [Acetobacteraceae bacterium]